MKKIIPLIGLLLCFHFSKAQWTNFNQANSGLSANLTWYVYEDNSHYLWVATNNGLNRYNLTNGVWNNYTVANSGISSNDIHGLVSDNSGTLWIATYGGGICSFDGTNWNVYNTANSNLPVNQIYHLTYDSSSNTIWGGTRYGGLVKFAINTGTWTTYDQMDGLTDDVIDDVAIAPNGDVWIACRYDGVAKYNGSNFTYYTVSNSGIAGNDIYSINVDQSGRVWAGATTGLSVFDGVNWTNYTTTNSSITGNYIRQIEFDIYANAWISTGGGGILKFNGTTAWTSYNVSNSNIPSNMIWASSLTNSNSIWISTFGGGIARMDSLQNNDTLFTRLAFFPPVAPSVFTSVSNLTKAGADFNLYPNPAKDILTLKVAKLHRVEVLDVTGKIVYNEICNGQLVISNLAAGIYTLKAFDNNQNYLGKSNWVKE